MKIDIKNQEAGGYPIYLKSDFEYLACALQPFHTENRKLCIVSDDITAFFYSDQLQAVLGKVCKKLSLFLFPAGEASKTLDTVRELYQHLILEKFDRKDMLVALGGGVVGDLTGFAAATYLRGMDFIQVPTTLLSQVDSSIGGKTGVDFDAYKNMVGAFYMPKLVYMNLGTCNTLPKRQFASGMAEIIKHGLIQDAKYYQWLAKNSEKIEEKDYDSLLSMIATSCRIKGHVVEEDPREQGIRAWLNFGHTVGHAIEKLKDFKWLHGECVAVGSVAAAWISFQRGYLTEEEFSQIEKTFQNFHLPIRVDDLMPEQILQVTKLDKKMEAGKIKFVLLRKIGEAFVARDVEDSELLEALLYICKVSKDE